MGKETRAAGGQPEGTGCLRPDAESFPGGEKFPETNSLLLHFGRAPSGSAHSWYLLSLHLITVILFGRLEVPHSLRGQLKVMGLDLHYLFSFIPLVLLIN